MSTETINTFIDDSNALERDEKEIALEIIRKAVAGERRSSIAKNALKAEKHLKMDNLKRGSADDLFNDL